RSHRRHAEHYRIVAVIDRLDIKHRDVPHASGIVAGPFAKRPSGMRALRRHVAFQHHFRMGGKWKPGYLAADHFDRPPAQSPDEIELEDAIRRLQAAEEKSARIA